MHDEVTWEARHLGVLQRLTTRITAYNRPYCFTDSMIQGAFARFDHNHVFEEDAGGTRVDEIFDYTSPFGPIGLIADAVFLKSYMARFLMIRLQIVKAAAESDTWQQYVSTT